MIAFPIERSLELDDQREHVGLPACPRCTGRLIEERGQMRCTRCHTICEDRCEGTPEWLIENSNRMTNDQ
jgi:hypothetical protein